MNSMRDFVALLSWRTVASTSSISLELCRYSSWMINSNCWGQLMLENRPTLHLRSLGIGFTCGPWIICIALDPNGDEKLKPCHHAYRRVRNEVFSSDQVICTPGDDDAMLVALDMLTGETIWKSKVADSPNSGAQATTAPGQGRGTFGGRPSSRSAVAPQRRGNPGSQRGE